MNYDGSHISFDCMIKKGNSYFVKSPMFMMSQRLFTPRVVEQKLKDSNLELGERDFYIWKWDKIFELMVRTDIYTLKIQAVSSNQYTPGTNYELLKILSPICFTNLKYLDLYSCAIVSIEAIGWLNTPNLKNLNLIYNYICSYKAITKSIEIELTDLYVYSKMPLSPDSKQLMRANSKFTCIGFQYDRNSCIISEDLSFLVKLPQKRSELGRIIQIKIGKGRRIKQQKCMDMFKRRFIHKINFQYKQPDTPQRVRRTQNDGLGNFMHRFANMMGYQALWQQNYNNRNNQRDFL